MRSGRAQITEGKWGKVSEMHQRVYSAEGVSPTITSNGGGNQEKKIVVDDPKCIVAGKMEGGKWDKIYTQSRMVYDPEGIAPTQMAGAGEGGNNETKIVVDDSYSCRDPREYDETAPTIRSSRTFKVVAFRGRPEDVSDHTPGAKLNQRMEERKDDLTNTITTCQKDNMILTTQRTEYGRAIRKDYEKGLVTAKRSELKEFVPRTDDISNTLTTIVFADLMGK